MKQFIIPYVNLVKMCNDKTILKVRYRECHQHLSQLVFVAGRSISPTLFNLGLERGK